MDLQLAGRRALVTGGSRGIGKAAAAALFAEGAQVAIAARSPEPLARAADDIAGSGERTVYAIPADTGERRVHTILADTGDDASVRQLAEQARELMGGIDILVNCAATPGGQSRPPSLGEITSEAFWADVNVKVLGYLRCAQAVAPGMVEAGWGRIISVSGLAARSTGSVIGSIRNVSVAAMTKNLADELGPHGVNVTVIHPGLTRTEATAGVVTRSAAATGAEPEQIERRMARTSSVGRLITAAEVGHLIAFLASPLSVSVNGEAIACGGGAPGVIHY